MVFSRRSLCYLKIVGDCYDIKPVRKEEGKYYWKIPLCDDDATREKIMHTTSKNFSVLYVLRKHQQHINIQ